MSGRSTGGFGGKLARFGQSVARVFTSPRTQALLRGAADVATRVAKSDLGSRVLSGAAQGALEAAVTGQNLRSSVQRAVILNVAGTDPVPVDPLSPGELRLASKVEKIEEVQEGDEQALAYIKKVEENHTQTIPGLLKAITDNRKAEATEETQITLLEKSTEALNSIVKHEADSIKKVSNALQREDINRTSDERKIITALSAGYERLRHAATRERDALIEEAVEQTVEVGANIAEHAAASIPLFGEGVAAGIATARGTIQLYRLGKTISELSGLSVDHLELPHVSRAYIKHAIEGSLPTDPEAALQIAVTDRLSHVEAVKKEAQHFMQNAIPTIKATKPTSASSNGGIPLPRLKLDIPSKLLPRIHIYTSAFGSDAVVILHVVAPLSMGEAFFLAIDLEYSYVYFADVYVPPTRFHVRAANMAGQTLETASANFFAHASRLGSDDRHARLIRASVREDPFYVGSVAYTTPYTYMRENARSIARTPEIQAHLLRGPAAYQRTVILNAVMHGFAMPRKAKLTRYPGPST